MSVKTKLLSLLEENRGKSISGNQIANSLGITRSAVWKAINSLKSDGYNIEAVTNKGYCLKENNDIISSEGIKPFLNTKEIGCEIIAFKSIDSTNDYAKQLASQGAKSGTVVISEEQVKGRGRMGRSFYSPKGSGIYMSIILRPKLSVEYATLITSCISVAIADAIEEICKKDVKIKWVNDLFIENRKICGILTEASMDFESGYLEYAIAGIGINFSTDEESFPTELKEIASSIFTSNEEKPTRNFLTAKILEKIEEEYSEITEKHFLEKYRARSNVIGKDIKVINGDEIRFAKALNIDNMARLVVREEDGSLSTLNSGEISIRVI